jgi:hypothetical protein
MKTFLIDSGIIIILSVIMVVISYFLTLIFGDKCWLPRVGALLVGFSVLLEGWIIYNPKNKGFDTMQPEKKLLKYVLFLALWGTLLWAFGDLCKEMFGIPVCR